MKIVTSSNPSSFFDGLLVALKSKASRDCVANKRSLRTLRAKPPSALPCHLLSFKFPAENDRGKSNGEAIESIAIKPLAIGTSGVMKIPAFCLESNIITPSCFFDFKGARKLFLGPYHGF